MTPPLLRRSVPDRGYRVAVVWMAALLGVSLATLGLRNEAFEFCTTRAYGFPLPWRYDWCLCERDRWPVQPGCAFGNLALAVGAGLLARRWLLRRRPGISSAGSSLESQPPRSSASSPPAPPPSSAQDAPRSDSP